MNEPHILNCSRCRESFAYTPDDNGWRPEVIAHTVGRETAEGGVVCPDCLTSFKTWWAVLPTGSVL